MFEFKLHKVKVTLNLVLTNSQNKIWQYISFGTRDTEKKILPLVIPSVVTGLFLCLSWLVDQSLRPSVTPPSTVSLNSNTSSSPPFPPDPLFLPRRPLLPRLPVKWNLLLILRNWCLLISQAWKMDFSLMLILFNRRGFHLFCLYALFHWTQSRVCNDQTYSCAHLHCRVLLYQAQTCSYGIPFSEINVELHTAFKSERLGNIMPGFSTTCF